jgi:hypothetical protein
MQIAVPTDLPPGTLLVLYWENSLGTPAMGSPVITID